MEDKSSLKGLFGSDDGSRAAILERARDCARLAKPWILPPNGQSGDCKLPENYQSLGSRGITNLSGKILLALFPPDQPWSRLIPIPEIAFDPRVPPEMMQSLLQDLALRDLQMKATLEAASLDARLRRRSTFLSKKRQAIDQLLVTGDVLEYMDDNFRLRVFRRDSYVTKRDSCGDVLYHITREHIDPLTLNDTQLAAAGLGKGELQSKKVSERCCDLYTMVEWQPIAKNWVIRQEVHDREILVSQEPVTPYFSTPFDLVEGENYGRGFIEQNLGDMKSLDEIGVRLLEFAELCSKMLPILDRSSEIREEDLEAKSGTVLRGDVRGGVVQDLAFMRVDKMQDFQVVHATGERIRGDLGKAMLIESETAPKGEAGRVSVAWDTVVGELNGALGGLFAPIADEQQLPLAQRTYHQMELKHYFAKDLPKEFVDIQALTGYAAISRAMEAGKVERLLAAVEPMARIDPSSIRKINIPGAVDILARLYNVHQPGLIKSDEQVAQETQQALAAQTQAEASKKAIDVAGNVAESKLTSQGTRNA